MSEHISHRFIPNSAPGIREEMLKVIGFDNVDEIYEEIPEDLRFKGDLNIPADPTSEFEVQKRIKGTLAKNRTTGELLSFLGAGSWPHYVPALCKEIGSRAEFVTAYAGSAAVDHGRYQAVFEYQSMIGDLFEMDVVSAPVYDGPTASGDAVQMAFRATGKRRVLVPKLISPDKLTTLQIYCDPWLEMELVEYQPETGQLDLDDLRAKITEDTAAVYIENPSYLGVIETQLEEISQIAHENGALLAASVYPTSLGVLAPPGQYDADIACGEGQPLGLTLSCGGATLGILASKNEKRFLEVHPSFLVGLTPTVQDEFAFSWHTLYHRTVYDARDKARSFTGTASWLWAIVSAVYMALLGPDGFRQLAETNMQKARYAMERLNEIKGVRAPHFATPHFNEFVVNFDGTGKTVAEINQELLELGIFGGKDISQEFPEFGSAALYCVTEIHGQEDIERLATALDKVTG
jgi:glycine dehydrogenase subunit 1